MTGRNSLVVSALLALVPIGVVLTLVYVLTQITTTALSNLP
jgi:hypothetical protein